MDIIKEYVEKIIVYVILTSYISVILPNNTYRKYIKFVMGAILVVIVLEPIEKWWW